MHDQLVRQAGILTYAFDAKLEIGKIVPARDEYGKNGAVYGGTSFFQNRDSSGPLNLLIVELKFKLHDLYW